MQFSVPFLKIVDRELSSGAGLKNKVRLLLLLLSINILPLEMEDEGHKE